MTSPCYHPYPPPHHPPLPPPPPPPNPLWLASLDVGASPRTPLNNKTHAVATDRLVCAPPCVCTTLCVDRQTSPCFSSLRSTPGYITPAVWGVPLTPHTPLYPPPIIPHPTPPHLRTCLPTPPIPPLTPKVRGGRLRAMYVASDFWDAGPTCWVTGGRGSQKWDTMPKTASPGIFKKWGGFGGGVKVILRCQGEPPIFSTNRAFPGLFKQQEVYSCDGSNQPQPIQKRKTVVRHCFPATHYPPPPPHCIQPPP